MKLLLLKRACQCAVFLLYGGIGLVEFPLAAQVPDYTFDHLTTEDGLPSSFVNDILQDQRGFMWFCTWDGLVRHDGYNFVTYKPDIRDSSSISSKLVYCAVEDPAGGLWVGTKHGLNFFDREKEAFERFQRPPVDTQNVLSAWIIDIAIDRDSNLWLATDQGLTQIRLDRARKPVAFKHYRHRAGDPLSLPDQMVMSVMVDHENYVWAGTLSGLVMIDAERQLHPFRDTGDGVGPTDYSVTAFYEDRDHHIWIGTKGGSVYQWSRATQEFIHFDEIGPYLPESNKYISSFCEDMFGNLWMGVFDGGVVIRCVDGSIRSLRHHSDDRFSLGGTSVKCLYQDRSGDMWIGVEGMGIDKFDLYRKPFAHYKHQSDDPGSLSFNTVMSFAEDPLGRMWIGTKEGINVSVPGENRFVHYKNQTGTINPLITDKIWSLYADPSAGIMWIGGHYGLIAVTLKRSAATGASEWIEGDLSAQFKHILLSDPSLDAEKHQVRAILRDRSGMLWVGTYHGLYGLKTRGAEVEVVHHFLHDPLDPQSLSNDIVIALFQDSRGDLWAGTRDGGLNRLIIQPDSSGAFFERFLPEKNNLNSLSNNEVACLNEDDEGNLWVGTNGGGLNQLERVYDPEQKKERFVFSHFGEQEGLLGDAVFGILQDERQNLWLSTNAGIFKFDPRLPAGLQFRQFTTDHGIQGNMFHTGAFYKSKSGRMYFGGQKGFNAFYADSIKENPFPPQVSIIQLEIFNKVVAPGEKKNGRNILTQPISETPEIHLSYQDNNFTLEFAALSYSSPPNNKYAYKLEGYDADWVYTHSSRRYAAYSNLKPGTYVFKVKAANADDVWNERYTQLLIHVGTPPWKTWWAICLYGMILLGFLYAFRHYTLNEIRLQNDLEWERAEHQKSEEINRLKLDFFTQISHEFRTPLTLIIGPVRELVEKGRHLKKEERRKHLKRIDFNARHLLRLIDQLLYFSKSEQGHMQVEAEQGDLVAFMRQVCDAFGYLALKKNIRLELHAQEDALNLWLDWDKMEKIFNNLLSNALKFTHEQGAIEVAVRLDPAPTSDLPASSMTVLIEVQDSGIGISPEQVQMIFGRFYQASTQLSQLPIGYGIGLALTKKLVEMHEGTIEVQSEEGVGTTFTIRLPYEKCRVPVKSGDRALAPDAVSSLIEGGMGEEIVEEIAAVPVQESHPKPLLLIVDDNPEIRSYLSLNLAGSYQVLEAENGQVAWELALTHIPVIVISDIMMPVMDGVRLCTLLKSDERTNHIPVILLTAKSAIEHRIEGLKAGADAYLPKPFHPRHLHVRIEKLIELRANLRKKYQGRLYEAPEDERPLSEDEKFLEKVRHLIEMRLSDTDFKVNDLELELGMSHMQLYRKLKALTDQSANEFIRTVRLKKSISLLKNTQLNINEVAYQVGFNSTSYFIKCFRKEFGLLPKSYSSAHKKQPADSSG